MTFWEWMTAALVTASADPAVMDKETPKAAAAVQVAYAHFAPDVQPEPAPPPAKCVCGGTCKNGIWKPDGRIEQPCPCPATCQCKAGKCPDGRCPK